MIGTGCAIASAKTRGSVTHLEIEAESDVCGESNVPVFSDVVAAVPAKSVRKRGKFELKIFFYSDYRQEWER